MSAHAPALEAEITVNVGWTARRFSVEAKLSLAEGVLVLFGPSGSGKSLTVAAIVGVVEPAAGRMSVCGETVFDADKKIWVEAHRRRIGYVPQHHSLFPFCDVFQNVAFGLARAERAKKSARVEQLIDELGLSHLSDAMPASLSGGERQRVALARALAVRPRLLALDEPFASIDHEGRDSLHAVLKAVLARYGTPAVFVTHDPSEALEIGDRMVRFERGKTVASGTPRELLGR